MNLETLQKLETKLAEELMASMGRYSNEHPNPNTFDAGVSFGMGAAMGAITKVFNDVQKKQHEQP